MADETSADQAREARSTLRRATWTATLSTEHAPMPFAVGTVEDRIRAVVELSRAAHLLSGQPWPSYDRATMPTKLFRPRDG